MEVIVANSDEDKMEMMVEWLVLAGMHLHLEHDGEELHDDATSNVWQFNPANNFAKADGAAMKKKRYGHGCGIVHSIHHGSRPLLVVAGSGSAGATGAKTSDYWDFTVPGSTWQLCSRSCSFVSYSYIIIFSSADKQGLVEFKNI